METPKNVCLYMFCMLNMHLYCIYKIFAILHIWFLALSFSFSGMFMVFHGISPLSQHGTRDACCQDVSGPPPDEYYQDRKGLWIGILTNFRAIFVRFAPPKPNMSPEKKWLEDCVPFEIAPVLGTC